MRLLRPARPKAIKPSASQPPKVTKHSRRFPAATTSIRIGRLWGTRMSSAAELNIDTIRVDLMLSGVCDTQDMLGSLSLFANAEAA